jgi:hypothetical protein
LEGRKSILHVVVLWRSDGGKQSDSNSEASVSIEVEAKAEGEFEAEPAACFEGDAKLAPSLEKFSGGTTPSQAVSATLRRSTRRSTIISPSTLMEATMRKPRDFDAELRA